MPVASFLVRQTTFLKRCYLPCHLYAACQQTENSPYLDSSGTTFLFWKCWSNTQLMFAVERTLSTQPDLKLIPSYFSGWWRKLLLWIWEIVTACFIQNTCVCFFTQLRIYVKLLSSCIKANDRPLDQNRLFPAPGKVKAFENDDAIFIASYFNFVVRISFGRYVKFLIKLLIKSDKCPFKILGRLHI